MTLDEAIKHAEEVADYDCYNEEQFKCSEEHRQLADWLKELKRLREQTSVLDKIRAEIEQLPINTRTNWNGCCPDNDYPEIEYVDVSKNHLLAIIDKYKIESEEEDE